MRSAFAWLGGALFVAALGVGAFTYAVALGAAAGAASGPRWRPIAANVALFSFFALHHSLLARTRVKAWIAPVVPAAMERSVYVWVASLLFIAVCLLWQSVPGSLWRVDGRAALAAHAVQLAGVWLTLRTASLLDALELAGIRQATAPRPIVFRAAGPFRLVRHPIYLGWLLMVFFTPEMTLGRFVFAAVSSAYLVLAIPWEERSLLAAFGETYRAYQQRVRWRLVPGLW